MTDSRAVSQTDKLKATIKRKLSQRAREIKAESKKDAEQVKEHLESVVTKKANWILFAIIGVVVVGVILSATGVIGG